jgi:F-type H+-transporting ATPase subunit gamma
MASLKDLRNRIASVKATQKITKAMQMVAAAKLRRAQEAAEAARPYASRMDRVMANLATGMAGREDAPKLLAGTGSDQVQLVIVATADRGLCGGFNSSIARLARQHINKLIAEGKDVKILTVGRKGRDILKRDFSSRIVKSYEFTGLRQIGFAQAEEISKTVLEMFEAGEFDVATLFYSKFVNVVSQVPTAQQLIPASLPEGAEGIDLGGAVYEYEPDEAEILKDLLPRNLFGAKMSAMDNATRNAGEMIKKLNITYNRSRQAMITKELIEIISGAEAL